MSDFEIILEQCYPGKGKKKGELRILTSELSGQKVGDIEYHKDLGFENSGDYRITRIVNVAARRRRLKNEQATKQAQEQVRAQETARLKELRAAFANDFEFMLDAFENGWSVTKTRTQYDHAPDECAQKVVGANVTKDTSQQTKLIEKLLSQERQRFTSLISAFDFDQEFAIKAWERGLTVEQAADEYYAPQEQTQEAAGAKTVVAEDSDSGSRGDFMTVGKELAAAEGIKLGEALKRVARKNPELHQAYKESCSMRNRADYGREV